RSLRMRHKRPALIMEDRTTVLAIETSCDETAVAILCEGTEVLASEVASQIDIHRDFGGVVPEVASRNHLLRIRPVIEKALHSAGLTLEELDAFAATAGPGLATALLVGNTSAKALALATGKPFFSVNHMEGHLLSPFIGSNEAIPANLSLIVSGGHTMLIDVGGFNQYTLCGQTLDDAAGEAYDKVGRMLDLPYPGGPEIDRLAASGNREAFDFPRSMMRRPNGEFSFSGLKTSVLYTLKKLEGPVENHLADLCASFQEAVVDVLVHKTLRMAREKGRRLITVSGGVSCNRRLREAFGEACQREGIDLLLAAPAYTTDNAAMIAYVAAHRLRHGLTSPLDENVNPNLPLATPAS
ncbi:MAG: tRNA (adenosine(37)-N6)-threonylcarbamoyltransferase complex transferase subunit TsaD, partial [Verrucomicrobiota bacterium]